MMHHSPPLAVGLKRIAGAVRRLLPPQLSRLAVALGTAVVTPIAFSLRTGHFRSALHTRAVDAAWRPLPWYTYPAIDFLAHQDMAGRRVLEWGAGHSTVWWTRRAASVTAFDSDPRWVDWVRRAAPQAVLHYAPDDLTDTDPYLGGAMFDLIVIEGLDRYRCACVSLRLLAEDGAIVLDNSEGYWGREGEYPILDLLRGQGFQRIDFYGFAPRPVPLTCDSCFQRPLPVHPREHFVVARHDGADGFGGGLAADVFGVLRRPTFSVNNELFPRGGIPTPVVYRRY